MTALTFFKKMTLFSLISISPVSALIIYSFPLVSFDEYSTFSIEDEQLAADQS